MTIQNTTKRIKPELLAPAGNLEKLMTAFRFGADAVYFAGNQFGLRAGAGNFTLEEMALGINFSHQHGKKAYLTLNILAHEADISSLPAYLKEVLPLKPDAVIVADPGILDMVLSVDPTMPIHLSTQANATNSASARFWHRAGVERIVLARELSLQEIKAIRANSPDTLSYEMFVHGAMCMSYSGRCMISYHLTGRDANRGDCAQPCRWKFNVSEEKRPGEFYPVEEDARGTYLFNSKDLCLLRRLPELLHSGAASFKIEGRMKSPFYVATVVKAWREAIDAAWSGEWREEDLLRWENEVASVSNRTFTEGFIDGPPGADIQKSETGGYVRGSDFIAIVPEGPSAKETATEETATGGASMEDVAVIKSAKNGTSMEDVAVMKSAKNGASMEDVAVMKSAKNDTSMEDVAVMKSAKNGTSMEDAATKAVSKADTTLPGSIVVYRQRIEQRNKFWQTDILECLPPTEKAFSFSIKAMFNEQMTPIDVAPNAQMIVYLETDKPLPPGSLLRRRV